ncbi:MAG: DNA polymerase III subunit gamma/tau [Rhabdochlamydiaceae bacterium]|nr:DNA polymerase III subunit gamma/tau [Rhabdochlamydiaceae bacterium]
MRHLVDQKKTSYQVIPRKYRPQTFASVVGQDAIVTTLKNALRFERLAHAYLFCGCRGTGKTTLARVFAKALNCQKLTENQEPCNSCTSCLDVMSGRSLDVLEIDGASNRGIDDIRQINETIGYAPASGKFKIYIIDEVHMLTKEAFNALLKTLEEPPTNVKFFFATTEPHKVLPTILSRCQRFDLNRISLETMQAKLNYIVQDLKVDCSPDALALISHLSEGCLRDAESLLDQVICYAQQPITLDKVSETLGLMPRAAFFALDAAINTQNLNYAFELSQSIFSTGKDLNHFLDNLVEHFRTHLHIKLGRNPQIFDPEEKKQYLSLSSHYTEEQCLCILDYLIHWQQQLAKTPFKRISLEMILLYLIRSKYRLSLATLTKRLIELEHTFPNKQEATIPASPLIIPQETPEPAPEAAAAPTPLTTETLAEPQPAQPQIPIETIAQQFQAAEEKPVARMVPEIDRDRELPQPEMPTCEKILPASQEIQAPLAKPSETGAFEQALLNKIKEKIDQAPTPTQPSNLQPVAAPSISEKPASKAPQGRYDTLIRFAAVELEGVVKKEI